MMLLSLIQFFCILSTKTILGNKILRDQKRKNICSRKDIFPRKPLDTFSDFVGDISYIRIATIIIAGSTAVILEGALPLIGGPVALSK